MKIITDSLRLKVIKDHETVIKSAPSDSIVWETHVLRTLNHIAGVPHIRGTTPGICGDNMSTIVMDLMPGEPLSTLSLSDIDVKSILSQIYTILLSIYSVGVAHMSIKKEDILYSSDGVVSLIGFSKAAFIEPNPMSMFQVSPDMIGTIDRFKITGPNRIVTGSYVSLARSLGC